MTTKLRPLEWLVVSLGPITIVTAGYFEYVHPKIYPPIPTPPLPTASARVEPEPPPTIAWTQLSCYETLTDDGRAALFAACGGYHIAHGHDFVACSEWGDDGPYQGKLIWEVNPKNLDPRLRGTTIVLRRR